MQYHKKTIIVFGGGMVKDHGFWRTTNYKEDNNLEALGDRMRVLAAAYLYKNNSNQVIFALGGRGRTSNIKDGPTISEIIKKELITLNVPEDKIFLESKSNNTFEQLKALKELIKKYNLKDIVIISNKYHLPRIKAMLQRSSQLNGISNLCKVELKEAEKIVIDHEPKYKKEIELAYKSKAMQYRIALENNGVKDIYEGKYKLKWDMKKLNKNLFIIFGTTSGIGMALYVHASNSPENDFILFNKGSSKIYNKNILKKLTIDLSQSFSRNNLSKLRQLFSEQKEYKNIYLVLNASVIEPISLVGFVTDALLVGAGFVNFLNYERIVNIFISVTKALPAKKKILAISSGSAGSPNIGLSSYCATKAALEMYIKCLFLEQQKNKEYSVIALRPGVVDTNMQKKIRSSKKENFPDGDKYKKIFKEKKLLPPEIVASKIYTLLNSDEYWFQPVIDISDIK